MNATRILSAAALGLTLLGAAARADDVSAADVQYYADFADAAKRIGSQLDKLGELLSKAAPGKDYSANCEDRAKDLADVYHFLEERVPPGDAVTAHKDLMSSADTGALAAIELAAYFDAEFRHKDRLNRALDLYDQAVTKYAGALEEMPLTAPEKETK